MIAIIVDNIELKRTMPLTAHPIQEGMLQGAYLISYTSILSETNCLL